MLADCVHIVQCLLYCYRPRPPRDAISRCVHNDVIALEQEESWNSCVLKKWLQDGRKGAMTHLPARRDPTETTPRILQRQLEEVRKFYLLVYYGQMFFFFIL